MGTRCYRKREAQATWAHLSSLAEVTRARGCASPFFACSALEELCNCFSWQMAAHVTLLLERYSAVPNDGLLFLPAICILVQYPYLLRLWTVILLLLP